MEATPVKGKGTGAKIQLNIAEVRRLGEGKNFRLAGRKGCGNNFTCDFLIKGFVIKQP